MNEPHPLQTAAKRRLDQYRIDYENGDHKALLRAIRCCAEWDLAMPQWVAGAYINAYDAWDNAEAKELGEAFGVAWPKGKRQHAEQTKAQLQFAVWWHVTELHRQGCSVNRALFETVGNEYSISGSLVERYYYEFERERDGIITVDKSNDRVDYDPPDHQSKRIKKPT